MRKTKYTVKTTTLFKKDFKLAMKRGLNIELLENVIALLSMGEPLPEKNKDHALTGNWVGHRECHILPEQFEQRHSRELILYDAAARYLKELKDSGEAITPKAWQREIDQLAAGKQTS